MECMSEELELIDRDRIDKAIWKSIGIKSVRQIADETGLKPEEVLRRKNELLDEVDVLSIQQKRQRLLIELDGMARDARERAANTVDEFYSGMLNSSVAAIKTMLTELARMERQDSGKIEALNNLRVKELLSIVEEAVVTSVKTISNTFETPEEEMMGIFQENLLRVAQDRDNG